MIRAKLLKRKYLLPVLACECNSHDVTSSTAVRFDPGMMARYGQSGPRYTSYPTALQFTDEIAAEHYVRAATASEDALLRRPLSLYVHIPFCFSPCLYCGCTKIVTRNLGRIERYVGHLAQEISWRGQYFDRARVVEQLHFGGGTPTYLPASALIKLLGSLARHFQLTDAAERDYSIEVDPRSIAPGTLQLLKELGFNRLSVGVQDFDSDVQSAINRLQPAEMVHAVYQDARDLGFQSINFDLIYGLPLQTIESFERTLDRVVAMRPDRLAVYGYAHMPQLFKAQRRISAAELPDASTRMAFLQLAVEKLCAAGYLYIGLDHFALPSDSLAQAKHQMTLHRSFQGYTTHANHDLVSFGVSAIGRVGNLYVQNHKLLADYEAAIERGTMPSERGVSVDQDDRIRGEVIQRIMCHGLIEIEALEARHDIVFGEYFAPELKRMQSLQEEGLVELTTEQIRLTPAGQLMMRVVAMAFDAYLTSAAESPAMSRVV
jgi:oxygen-independent coproporphyrinogen-3 oxidase